MKDDGSHKDDLLRRRAVRSTWYIKDDQSPVLNDLDAAKVLQNLQSILQAAYALDVDEALEYGLLLTDELKHKPCTLTAAQAEKAIVYVAECFNDHTNKHFSSPEAALKYLGFEGLITPPLH